MEPLDAKTAWELYKKVDGFASKLEDMDSRQSITLQEMKAEQRASHFEMLDAVDKSVEKSTRFMQAVLDGFRQEIKNVSDDHERRLIEQEQKEQTNRFELNSLIQHTNDLPLIRETLSCLDTRTINFPDVEETVAALVKAPGNKAISAWKRVLIVAGFMGLAIFSAWIGSMFANKPIEKTVKLMPENHIESTLLH
jgi:hypothetical protein